MTFSVLFIICSWLTAFSCFSLCLLEGSDILSLHSESKIPFFFQLRVIVWNGFPFVFIQRQSPAGAGADQQCEGSLWAGRMHPLLLMPSSFNSGKGGLQKTPLMHKCSLFIWRRGACLGFVVVVLKGKTKQHSLVWGSTRIQTQNSCQLAPPWSNTQWFVSLSMSY